MTEGNRLDGSPKLNEPALGIQPVAVVERSPTGIALVGQTIVKGATVVVAVAAAVAAVMVVLPPTPLTAQITAICIAIATAGAALGIASPGARAGGSAGAAPVTDLKRPPGV